MSEKYDLSKDDVAIVGMNEMSRRRFLEVLGACGLLASSGVMLTGCNNNGQSVDDAAMVEDTVSGPVTVIDAKGNEFVIPEKIERIAITCNGGATHEALIFGGPEKIVAQPSMKRFPQLLKMFPQFNDVVDAGSFDDLNIEALLATEPDVALVGIKSEKGNAQVADMGIPTYVMLIGWAAIDTLKQEFLNVGKICGNESKAQELVNHWDRLLGEIQARAAKIPESEKKSVYYISSPVITKANLGDWGRTWIDAVGATFAVPESDLNGDVTIEKTLEWNPDIIICQGGKDINELYTDDKITEIKAIKDKALYSVPIGGFWWDRPSPEATLGFLWLAKTVYPEQFKDMDLKKETKEFFKQFYDYELPDAEYDSFFG